jgi:hypothetical protein
VAPDEQNGVGLGVEPGEHAERAGLSPDQVRPGVEILGRDVPERPVGVGHPHDGIRFGVQHARDDRVRLGRHRRPAPLVVVPVRVGLGGMHDRRDAPVQPR